MASRRPLILITPRWEQQVPSVRVPEPLAPEETMACVFADAIVAAGGTPLMMALTEDEGVIDGYLEMADGIAVPGGQDTQLLNVVLGGTLCMDVPGLEPREGMALWRHQMVLTDPVHPVEVEEGSLLSRALGGATLVQANSSHHCCVERLGEGVRLVARATDGVPEGIEVEGRRFALGVQWHPEYTWRSLETDFSLWRSFVEACR